MLHAACKLITVCVPAQAKLEAKEREHFKKKGISFEGTHLQQSELPKHLRCASIPAVPHLSYLCRGTAYVIQGRSALLLLFHGSG
jgi:hypothetical protein